MGKQYSYTERQINSSKLQYEYSYLPSHPIITPISMLFGLNKEDVLKMYLNKSIIRSNDCINTLSTKISQSILKV